MTVLRHFILYMMTALLIMAGLWIIGFTIFSGYALRAEPQLTRQEQADAIVVLTGGDNRVNTGIKLLENKAADRLFISGTHEAVTIDDILKLNNTDEKWKCCIDLDPLAKDTDSNARQTVKWIIENDIDSIILVTSAYHMTRARNEIDMILTQVYENKLRPTSDLLIYEFPLSLEDIKPNSVVFWRLVFKEYNKTILSFAKRLFKAAD